MRGEQWHTVILIRWGLGSPPHARGAAKQRLDQGNQHRITPACAGSRLMVIWRKMVGRDHPRMRGEQEEPGFDDPDGWGSPPHARGAALGPPFGRGPGGITPACAGSRTGGVPHEKRRGDHPRMRGEQKYESHVLPRLEGSPPHARGAVILGCLDQQAPGITPACAGSSACFGCIALMCQDHPRMRGEQRGLKNRKSRRTGSPPHARGAADGKRA